ncbi:hypothetical protein [Morganella morganii IS15]|nr:hypothetical protein [Morganella morganii IS15]
MLFRNARTNRALLPVIRRRYSLCCGQDLCGDRINRCFQFL